MAHGGGPLPTHVSYILGGSDGHSRLQIHQHGTQRSRPGIQRELVCIDKHEFDAQMEFMIAAGVPFMVGHMSPGASDDAYLWLKEKGRRVDYLEISYGGKSEWQVREIFEDAKAWRGVKLKELLRPDIDLFTPENRPRVVRPEQKTAPAPAPEPDAASPQAITPAPAAEMESTPALPAPTTPEKTALPAWRWVDNGSALILMLLLVGSFWRATDYLRYVIPFDLQPVLTAVALAALAGATAYAALWFTLFPRYFPRWTQRLELLALSLIMSVLIAFCELMIANIRYDDAPRIAVPTEVKAKMIYKGKYGRHPPEHWTYQLVVKSWTDADDEQTLRVSRETWDSLEPGSRIVFHPHPGRLGWVWYSVAELEAPDFVNNLPR